MKTRDIILGISDFGLRACVNTYHLRNDHMEDMRYPTLSMLTTFGDTHHRYKAPHANRPGDRPYERKKR